MQLDVRTVFLMLGLATLAGATSLFLAQRMKLSVEGIRYWAWGLAASAIGGFLLSARGAISPVLSVLLGNGAVLLGYSLAWLGMRRFVGAPVKPALMLGAPLLALPVLALYFLDDRHVAGRIAFLSVLIALLTFMAAFELLKGEQRLLGRRWVAALLIAHGLFYLFRAAASLIVTDVADPFAKGSVAMATGIEAFLFIVFITLGMIMMMSEALQAELNRHATRDPLTDAYNRRAFHELFEKERMRAARAGSNLALMLMDIDHFKRLNDTYGHQVGDLALQHFVALTSRCLRSQDVLARFGGEEFVILLPDTPLENARVVAERIRAETASHPVGTPQGDIPFTVSIGLTSTPAQAAELQTLIERADAALYDAKLNGRNRVVLG